MLTLFSKEVEKRKIRSERYQKKNKAIPTDGFLVSYLHNSPQQIQLINTEDAVISQCSPKNPVHVFLSVKGKDSRGIVLLNNRLKNAHTTLVLEEGLANTIVTEIETIKY